MRASVFAIIQGIQSDTWHHYHLSIAIIILDIIRKVPSDNDVLDPLAQANADFVSQEKLAIQPTDTTKFDSTYK